MDWLGFGQQIYFGLTIGMGYAIFAVGLTIIFGILGIINVAHGEFYMLGAMFLYYCLSFFGLNYGFAVLISITAVVLLSIICNRLFIQPLLGSPNLFLAAFLSTIGLSIVLLNGSVSLFGSSPKPTASPFTWSISAAGFTMAGDRLMILPIGTVILIGLFLFIARSRIGKSMQATSQNRLGASLVGVEVKRVYAITFALASGLAALAAVILAPVWSTSPFMGQTLLLKAFVCVIVAGLGNIKGAVIVGLLLGISEALFGQYVSMYYRDAFGYILMLIMLSFRPRGLFVK